MFFKFKCGCNLKSKKKKMNNEDRNQITIERSIHNVELKYSQRFKRDYFKSAILKYSHVISFYQAMLLFCQVMRSLINFKNVYSLDILYILFVVNSSFANNTRCKIQNNGKSIMKIIRGEILKTE